MLSFSAQLDNFTGKLLTEKVLVTLALLVLVIDSYLLLFYGMNVTYLDNWQKIIKPTTVVYFVAGLALTFLAVLRVLRAIFLFVCSFVYSNSKFNQDYAKYREDRKEYLAVDELREMGIHEQNEMAYHAYEKYQDESSENELKRTLYCNLLLVGIFNFGLSFFTKTRSLTWQLIDSFPLIGGISLLLLLLITTKYGVIDNVDTGYDKITMIKRLPKKT